MIGEIVGSLGLSGRIATAGSVAVVAWYIYRASGLARSVAGVLGFATQIGIALVLFVALGVGLGWVDLSMLAGDMIDASSWILESGIDRLLDLVGRLL